MIEDILEQIAKKHNKTEEKETQAAGYISKQHSQQSSQKKYNNHRYKKPNPL